MNDNDLACFRQELQVFMSDTPERLLRSTKGDKLLLQSVEASVSNAPNAGHPPANAQSRKVDGMSTIS